MSDVHLIDVSLRDGNQSLWGAVGVRTRTIGKVSPILDRCNYHSIESMSSTLFAVSVRYHKEDPWEKLDLARRLAPSATFGFLTTGQRFITFSKTPKALLHLAYSLLRRHGITRMWVADPMLDMEATKANARVAKQVGFSDVVAGLCYTISPVHTDAFFAERISELDECADVDAVYLKDPSGLLTPQRLQVLVDTLREKLKRLKIEEIHTHCSTGIAPLTLLTAADLGFTKLHCALPPLANGTSHTNALQLVRNLEARGHSVSADFDEMERASRCLQREASLFDLPQGAPVEYDESYYHHTLPGGVLTTTRRQLGEMGKADLMPQVIEEAVRVRADLGWPIVVTPFAQYIVTQASINVMTGERYSRISDEVVDLVLGEFGEMPGAINPELLDRVLQTPRGRAGLRPADDRSLDDFRKQLGSNLSDEELLLRGVMPTDQVEAMLARKARVTDHLGLLLEELNSDQTPISVSVNFGTSRFSACGAPAAGGSHG